MPLQLSEGIQFVLDLSTGHIKCTNPETYPDINWGSHRTTAHDTGWTLYLCEKAQEGEPEWLKPIVDYARKHDCLLINFDMDAPSLERFQTWQW